MPSCQCKLCKEHRRVQAIKATGSMDELRALIDELEECLANVEADDEYYCAILDGSWPSAREIAQGIIERCDKVAAPVRR